MNDMPLEKNRDEEVVDTRAYDKKINELNAKLKEKEAQIAEEVRKWKFYEQIVKNLTTFK